MAFERKDTWTKTKKLFVGREQSHAKLYWQTIMEQQFGVLEIDGLAGENTIWRL